MSSVLSSLTAFTTNTSVKVVSALPAEAPDTLLVVGARANLETFFGRA